MDFTSRMVALLGELRRERNGAVADAMRCYGAPYGLNYGVSLPTLRKLARAETPDHDFARYLYLQEVRELRLAALHIARPESLTPDEFPAWAAGIVNSEVAEEAAFAFLSRSAALPALDRRPESAASIRRLALRRPQRSSYGGMDRARRRSGPPRRRMRRRDPRRTCCRSAFRIIGRPPDRAGGRRAAVCRRRPERGEPAGGTPRSRFSG